MTLRDILARVVRLNKALGEGHAETAAQIGRELQRELETVEAGRACPECGLRFQWPGQLEEHIRLRHVERWEAHVAAA